MDDVAFLRALPVFRTLEADEVTRLLAEAERRTYAPGTRIVRRGDPGDGMYIVREGAVQVPVVDGTGERRLTAYLGPGDFFGEMALLTGGPRAADVVADGEVPCSCLLLSKRAVDELLKTKPRVARFLTEILGRRLLESGHMRQVGKYRVVAEIGRGGAAIVFEGLHPTLKRSVAIKMLSHELVYEHDFAERFLDEARIIADLRHDNIVQVYDQEAAFATFFIVMERLSGMELSTILKEGRLSAEETRHILQQVCRGLQYAHRRGVVHRDIKPSNIFVEDTGRVKVMDFGIAIGARGEVRAEEGIMGTPGYIAPEALLGHGIDHRADIYALGVVAYMMLAGTSPFSHRDKREVLRRQLSARCLDVTHDAPDAPPALVELVRRATEHDREDRFQDCGEILKLLDDRTPGQLEDGQQAFDIQLLYPLSERDRVDAVLARLKQDLEQAVPGARLSVRELA